MGDVGQNAVEEIDRVPVGLASGANYGWSVFEGDQRFSQRTLTESGVLVTPVLTYRHEGGACSVTGGVVHHGSVTSLAGEYLYGDFCTGRIFAVEPQGDGVGTPRELPVTVDALVSFGVDDAGETYVVSLGGGVSRLVGT